MPRRAPHICPAPGCNNLTTHGRCPPCRQADNARIQANPDYRARQKIYAHPRWRRTRKLVLTRDIWCREPGCVTLATDADHILPLRDVLARGLDPFDPANAQGLCKRHHSAKTAREVFRRT